MTLERTDYYMSKSRALQEVIWEDKLIAQQKTEQIAQIAKQMQFSAQFGNMDCAINA